MKTKYQNLQGFQCKGITLIEILLVISLLVILLSFAIPSVGGAAAKAELTVASENVTHSIQSARNMARMNEARVILHFDAPAGHESHSITFSSDKHTGLLDYQLPEDIVLIADQDSFVFDERGLAANPGQLTLASKSDDNVTSTIDVR